MHSRVLKTSIRILGHLANRYERKCQTFRFFTGMLFHPGSPQHPLPWLPQSFGSPKHFRNEQPLLTLPALLVFFLFIESCTKKNAEHCPSMHWSPEVGTIPTHCPSLWFSNKGSKKGWKVLNSLQIIAYLASPAPQEAWKIRLQSRPQICTLPRTPPASQYCILQKGLFWQRPSSWFQLSILPAWARILTPSMSIMQSQ